MSQYGEKIKNLRRGRGLTQKDLAEQLGVITRTVSYWESGRECGFDNLVKIAEFFDVTTDELLGRKRKFPPDK